MSGQARGPGDSAMPPKLEVGVETQRVNIMASKTWVDAINEWRRTQPDIPTKSEAIRILVNRGLGKPDDAGKAHEDGE